MRLLIEFDDKHIDTLIHRAVMRGFKREEPRKVWSANEIKSAIRWLAERMLTSELEIHR